MKQIKPKLKLNGIPWKLSIISILVILSVSFGIYFFYNQHRRLAETQIEKLQIADLLQQTESALEITKTELDELKKQDQYQINQNLSQKIKNIESTYKNVISTYEKLLNLKELKSNTEEYDKLFTKALVLLSEQNYATASFVLEDLSKDLEEEQEKTAVEIAAKVSQNVPQSNAPPGSGYGRQSVSTDVGNFTVSIVAADLGSTRIIVDTASDKDCANDCPVLALSDYVSRNGAFAGINGSYFCPATYPSCAGKTNSYDTLAMNKNKVYFNSENNVYSTVPAVIFGEGWIRFVSASSQWGRDTGVNGVLANYPLLVADGNVVFGGSDDPKQGSKGNRSFVANKGNTVFIGVVHGATVSQSAKVMKALSMENALNLDDGGSTALWYGGYKVGPGRNLPNVVLFVRK